MAAPLLKKCGKIYSPYYKAIFKLSICKRWKRKRNINKYLHTNIIRNNKTMRVK